MIFRKIGILKTFVEEMTHFIYIIIKHISIA